MNSILNEMKTKDPDLFNALETVIKRLNPQKISSDVASTIAPGMKIGNLSGILFGNQRVKIIYKGQDIFAGSANDLLCCKYKDCIVHKIGTTTNNIIIILIADIVLPE